MKKVMTQLVASAAILFGVVGSTSAAVSNAAWLQGTSLDGGSTDLRGTNPKLISWSAHSSIDPTAFKHSLVDATQLTVTKDGDYFVAATLPIQGAAVRSVDTLEVFVNDEAVPGAISRCTYIRNANAQTESSAHIAQLIPGLKANDVITVKTYRGSATNPRTDMGTASLFVELLDDSRNVFGSTSAGTGNANLNRAAGEEDMYLKWDGVGREGSAFSAADSTITLKDQGSYLVTVNVPLQGNVVRASVGLSLLLGDPEDGDWALGGLAQQGYIRHYDGHNKASIHFSGVINTAEANTDLTVYLEQRAAAGDVTLGGKLASIFIEKISTDGLFHATATQMVNGENWNPDKKDQVSWEEEDRVIDSNTFGHGGDDLQNIVIKKAGSYLLAYNDVLEGGNLRANPRITVEVNGAEVPGAQTKSHYNRRAGGHDEVSGSMVVLLENLAADDVVTVSAQREGNGGIVTATEPALLSLIRKDNLSLPSGDQSPPRFSSFSGGLSGFSAIVEDFGLKLDAATLKATLNGEVVDVTVDSANGVNSINYAFAAFPPTGSEHALNIAFNDTGGNAHSMDFAFTVTTEYQTISPAFSLSDVNKDKGGFRVNLTQISARQTDGPTELHGGQWVNAEKQLRGEYLNPNDWDDDDNPVPYLNEADPDAWEGWSIAPVDVDYVNMNQDEDGNIGNFGEDQMFPNIPGWGESTDGIAGEFLTVLHLKRGFQTLGINSDDGFRATIGTNFQGIESQQIGLFNGTRAAADSLFNIVVTEEGHYPLRVLWWEAGGPANIEIFSIVDGVKILVNDPDNENAIKAYNIGNSTGRTYFSSVSPAPDDPTAVENSISATFIEDGTKAKSGSIKVLFNGKEVDASTESADGVVTVTAEPNGGIGIGSHTAKIVFTETTSPETERSFEWSFEVTALSEKIRALVDGEPNPIAYWDFDFATDAATAFDHVFGYQGDLVNAKYTEDKGGHTGEAGDRAMDFLVTPAGMLVQDAEFLDIASGINKVTISVWVKNHAILPNATVFFALTSTDNPGTDMEGRTRFASFHIPWGNENIYFDTAGCCSTATHRIVKNNSGFSWDEWHHYVFVKDENHKSIWIDGELFHEGDNTLPLPRDNDLLAVGSDIVLGRSFSGIVDDLAIFASALTEEQIIGLSEGNTDILPEKREVEVPLPDIPILLSKSPTGAEVGEEVGEAGISLRFRGIDFTDLSITVNGKAVDPTITSDSMFTTITADGAFSLGKNVITLSWNGESETWNFFQFEPIKDGEPNPIAYWDFDYADDPATAYDHVFGLQGDIVDAKYTEDKGGHTGEAGDYAMDFLETPTNMFVQDGEVLDIATSINKISFSVWVKNHATSNATVFWANTSTDTPGSDNLLPPFVGRTRVASFHIPWGNENIYFDTAGCCDVTLHRIFLNNSGFSWDEWHHYAFVKDENHKSIWIDGELFHEGENTLPLPRNSDFFSVGSRPDLTAPFMGIVDDLAIFASALTEEQIVGLAEGNTDILPEKRDPAPDLTISVVRNADGTVTVTYTGKLQVAPTVNGPWEDVEGATSPLTLQPDQPATFGRTVSE